MHSANKFRFRRRVLQSACAGFLAAAALAAASTPASAANIFEALFGVRRAPPQAAMPAYQPGARELVIPGARQQKQRADRKERARRNAARVSPDGGKPRPAKGARPPVLAGPLGPFLLDPTLRRGDVVVTTAGLKVFTGGSFAGQHNAREFQALSQATRFVPGNTNILLSIDRANRLSKGSMVETAALPRPGEAAKPGDPAKSDNPAKPGEAAKPAAPAPTPVVATDRGADRRAQLNGRPTAR